MKAMILSAGLGSRMRPLTNTIPKPLLQAGGKALIVWHIENLIQKGFKEIVINIAHLGYQIPQALGDGSQWGINISYSDEQEEGGLESAGGIIKALPLLGEETFLVVNADVFCDYTFDMATSLEEGILAHLILVPNPEHNPKGDFDLQGTRVLDSRAYTFSGIGYYSPTLFTTLAYGKSSLAPLLRTAMKQDNISGELYQGRWFDIGTPQRLQELNHFLDTLGYNK
ncbi:MAG: nucleotidyltransferase family protein [Sulfurovum sp.]|nr:nucleotidyltransferase family protein [Sulfurovum sp.]